jgi:hypothetical protein
MTTPLAPRPAKPATAAGPPTHGCPRCGQPLVDPQGLGWCKACGYCQSLGTEPRRVKTTEAAAPRKPTWLEAGKLIGWQPLWFWVAIFSVTVLALGTYLAFEKVHPRPLPRALWTTIQIGVGVAFVFLGQFLALLRLAPEETTLGFKDAIVPGQLYGLMFKHLPATRWPFYLCCWGLTLIITANVFVGGLNHWFQYLPRKTVWVE